MLRSELNPTNEFGNLKHSESFINHFGSSSEPFKTGLEYIFNIVQKTNEKFRLYMDLYNRFSENSIEDNKDELRKVISIQIYYALILKHFTLIILQKRYQNVLDNVNNLFDEIDSFSSTIINCLEQNKPWAKNVFSLLNDYGQKKDFLIEIQNTDFFQIFFLELFPRKIRKSLGEVYTPYWLAQHIVLESSWLDHQSYFKILDPSCGSGSFIKAFVSKILNLNHLDKTDKFDIIIDNIYGFDINPLAVFTTKINFLFQIIDIIPKSRKFSIPIYVKNIFSSLSNKKHSFDYIIGNPPWINWEHLTEQEKKDFNCNSTIQIFNKTPNLKKTLGYVKQDLSGIFFLYVAQNYLKNSGKISFLLNKSLINGKANSNFRKQFFRQHNQKNKQKTLGIILIEDLSEIQPFRNTKTSTIILHVEKSSVTNLEIPFKIWKEKKKEKVTDFPLRNIIFENSTGKFIEYDEFSNLITIDPEKYLTPVIRKKKEKKTYIAKEGANTEGLNSAYWITNVKMYKENLVLFDNYNLKQKNKITLKTKVPIEKDLIFPLIRSGNLKRWTYNLDTYIIFPAKYSDIEIRNENRFKELYPFTYKYFTLIGTELKNRKSYQGKSKNLPFYIMYGNKDMISGYKVCWNRMSSSIDASVIQYFNDSLIDTKQPVPQETVVYINTGNNIHEAHFLCAILNSELFNDLIKKMKIPGSKSFGTPDILNYINIPTFDLNNNLHMQISETSKKIHHLVQNEEYITPYVLKINELVKELFEISE